MKIRRFFPVTLLGAALIIAITGALLLTADGMLGAGTAEASDSGICGRTEEVRARPP